VVVEAAGPGEGGLNDPLMPRYGSIPPGPIYSTMLGALYTGSADTGACYAGGATGSVGPKSIVPRLGMSKDELEGAVDAVGGGAYPVGPAATGGAVFIAYGTC
jgi:hypothetical protein